MGRRARSKSPKDKRTSPAPARAGSRRRDLAGGVVFGGAAVAVLASWLALDPRSIDAFDAPKILLAQTGIAAAAGAALWMRLLRPDPLRVRGDRRSLVILALFVAGLFGAILSSIASPHAARSLDALRSAFLLLLALGVGCSVASSKRFPRLTALFTAAATLNAALVILAARGIYSPLVVIGQTKRAGLGALLGNAGHLGISLAFAAVALLPHAISGKFRWAARAALAVVVAGIFATQTLSGLAALAGGTAVYLVLRFRRRAAVPIFAVVMLIAAAVLGSRQLRFRLYVAADSARRGDWNKALSARAAPWLAATEMIRARPWLGIGPGNFAGEFIPNRVAAEARYHQRLVVNGMATNSFSEAHSDYLEIVAAIGIPSGLCLVASFALLLSRLISLGLADPAAAGESSNLVSGAIAAATWFPFQIAASSVWLLLLLGAAFHRVQSSEPGETR